MIATGAGLFIPAMIINGTVDIDLIGKRFGLVRIIGMISCVPTLVLILPF